MRSTITPQEQARPWQRLRANLPTWLVLGLLAASLLAAILLQRNAQESQGWVRHTLEVRNQLARLGQGLLAAESGQRGYLLTRDERSIALHRDETAGVQLRLSAILAATTDNPAQQARLRQFTTTLNDKLGDMQASLNLAAAGRWDAARAAAANDRARRLTDALLAQLNTLDEAELRLLNERSASAARSRSLTLLAMALALLAAAVAAVLEARRQRIALGQSRAIAAELEARVRERTADLAQSLALNRALTEEVHHRAGNGLTLVASFLSLQANELQGEAAEALEEARRRVVALASAQRRLRVDTTTGSVDLSPYLKGIIADIRLAIGDAVRIDYEPADGPVIEPSATAVSIGVIAGEMITNAVKHGFPAGMPGRITLRLRAQAGRILMEVEDDGIGFSPAAAEGLGSQVLPALAESLNGTLARGPARNDAARPGTLHRLDIPASAHQAAT